ncbi:MAG: hypothetical protein AAF293_20945 [Pseudomonadota bacterium]
MAEGDRMLEWWQILLVAVPVVGGVATFVVFVVRTLWMLRSGEAQRLEDARKEREVAAMAAEATAAKE